VPATRRFRLSPIPALLGAATVATVVVAVIAVGPETAASATQDRTVSVGKGVVQSTVSGSGALAPARQFELQFGTSGKVVSVKVKAGQHVKRDQVLATLDDSSANVDLAQANADLAVAQDQLTTAESSPSSATSSSSGSSGGTMSVASAQAAVDSAQLNVQNAQAALDATKLRAPAAGTIAAVNGAVGDTVSAGTSSSSSASSSSTASSGAASSSPSSGSSSGGGSSSASTSTSTSTPGFITLAKLSRMQLDVSLSEADVGKVKKGQQATVTINAVPGEQVAGHVVSIGVLASSSSSSTSSAVSYPVTIRLDQSAKGIKAGMSASADIVTAQASGLTVPNQALQGSSVTVLRNGKSTTQTVQTGVAGDSSTIVLSGLQVGDEVVVQSTSAAAGAAALGSGAAQAGPGGARPGFGGGGFGGAGGGARFGAGGGPPGGGVRPGG
jgi:multidrug efflux pump subunit AcrA (membrane-fusion protein)